ncbi:MAG: hypothetical protein LIO75_06935 [Lachnospiraceae bacterium]|nr:hypothetical protein [Lachnospiraceae bacterium]
MDETNTSQPVLDTLIRSRDLQILKAMVPYFNGAQQRTISFVIRLVELQKTMQLFDTEPELQAAELRSGENESPAERTRHMLNAMKEFCSPQEQANIESVIGFFEMFESYEAITADGERTLFPL